MKKTNVRRMADVKHDIDVALRSVLLVKQSEIDNYGVQVPLTEIVGLLDKTLDRIRVLK